MIAGGAEFAVTPVCAVLHAHEGPLHAQRGARAGVAAISTGIATASCSRRGAMFVLESEEHAPGGAARRSSARSRASAVPSSDASHITFSHAGGSGAVLSMRRALKDANLGPEDVDYVNAHGTSTPLATPPRSPLVKTGLRRPRAAAGVSSTKSMHGHTWARPARSRRSRPSGRCARASCRRRSTSLARPTGSTSTRPHARERPVRVAMNNTFGSRWPM